MKDSRLDIPVQSSAIRFVHRTHGVHCNIKRGETDGHTQGYKNLTESRSLVFESQVPTNLSPAYTGSSKNVPATGLAGEFKEIRLDPKQVFNFVGYQFDLSCGQVRLTLDQWHNLQQKVPALLS